MKTTNKQGMLNFLKSNKLRLLIVYLIIVLVVPLVRSLSPNPTVTCCEMLIQNKVMDKELCQNKNLTSEKCETILEQWNKAMASFSESEKEYAENIQQEESKITAGVVFLIFVVAFIIFKLIKRKRKKPIFVLIFILFLFFQHSSFAVVDSNQSNNVKSISINVNNTDELEIRFFELEPPGTTLSSFDDSVTNQFQFINKTYPLADDGLVKSTGKKQFPDLNLSLNGPARVRQLIDILQRDTAIARTFLYDRAAFIMPDDGFETLEFPALGVTYRTGGTEIILAEEGYSQISGHEIGHTYGLCDEYNETTFSNQDKVLKCQNGDLDGNGLLDMRCKAGDNGFSFFVCPIENETLIAGLFFEPAVTKLYNLMGAVAETSNRKPWVNKESYSHLFSKLRTSAVKSFFEKPAIIISGFFDKDGTIRVNSYYVSQGGFLSNQTETNSSGSISIKTKDSFGASLSEINLTPAFGLSYVDNNGTESIIELNQSYFTIILPFENVTEIMIKNNTAEIILSDRNRSANVPNITWYSPSAGQQFYDPFLVDWSASDGDGDSMVYAVLVSQDGGVNFTTWAIDVNDTNVTIDNKYFQNSSASVVKVLATDGVNTNFSMSSNFTIVPTSVRIVNITDLAVNSTTSKIFDVLVENDGNTVLNNISWTFNNGEIFNITTSIITSGLNISETMDVYVAYNYSNATNRTVTFNVSAGLTSDKKNFTIT